MGNTLPSWLVAAAAGLAVVAVSVPSPAWAASKATAGSAVTAVTAGSWGAVPTLPGAAVTPGALTLTFTNGSSPTANQWLFDIVNNGTLTLKKATFAFAATDVPLAVESCSGTWTSATACSGSVTVLMTTSTTSATSASLTADPTAPGTRVPLRLRQATAPAQNTTSTYTVNINVVRADVRALRTTNS